MVTRLGGILALALWAAGAQAGVPYYVDCAQGADAADGRAPESAWRSVGRAASQPLRPGDALLFRRGTVCEGMLSPQGSGARGEPIVAGAWGSGPLPRIEARPSDESAFKLWDQEYWTVQDLEFSGGRQYGVLVGGTEGVLHDIQIRDIVVHDVNGPLLRKESGLVVVTPGGPKLRFDGVRIEGVQAYRTSQWAGILVGSAGMGFLAENARSTNVVVRNSLVHDVQGDGIILFQVNGGLLENNVAWRTGLQKKETIGTPNGIWTWMCRGCTVRRNEAFLTDSPDIDGGAFDIDYGSDDTLVEENYAHDTQGYCVAVFGAGWTTSNSVVRDNLCVNNGLRARLALRQGAVYLKTWNHGWLKGVQIYGNRIEWNPPVNAPALQNAAAFQGTGSFARNTIVSSVRSLVASNRALQLDHNTYHYAAPGESSWKYGGKRYQGFKVYTQNSRQDASSRFVRVTEPPKAAPAGSRQWRLLAFPDSGDLLPFLAGAQYQFRELGLKVVSNRAADAVWGLEIRADLRPQSYGLVRTPALALVNEEEQVLWRREGRILPGDLGTALRSLVGTPGSH